MSETVDVVCVQVNDSLADAYSQGRRAGLATAALAASGVAFLSLLGIEKAALALTLGILALRQARPASAARRLALMAIVIAAVYVVSFFTLLWLYRDELAQLIRLLHQLG